MRKFFVFCLLIALSSMTYAQSMAVDEGSAMISLTGSISKLSGDLFVENMTASLGSDIYFFAVKDFAVGGSLQYQSSSGDESKIKRWGVGPIIGYFFGDVHPSMVPFLSAGLMINTVKLDENPEVIRTQGIASCGVLLTTADHFAFNIKLSYRNILEESRKGTIALGLGITGLL